MTDDIEKAKAALRRRPTMSMALNSADLYRQMTDQMETGIAAIEVMQDTIATQAAEIAALKAQVEALLELAETIEDDISVYRMMKNAIGRKRIDMARAVSGFVAQRLTAYRAARSNGGEA